MVSTLGFLEFEDMRTGVIRADVTRVASNVVVGVGFLGAGMILKRHGQIANLTTAASIWTVAAIGLAAGVGDVGTACVAALLTLGYLVASCAWSTSGVVRTRRYAGRPPGWHRSAK